MDEQTKTFIAEQIASLEQSYEQLASDLQQREQQYQSITAQHNAYMQQGREQLAAQKGAWEALSALMQKLEPQAEAKACEEGS